MNRIYLTLIRIIIKRNGATKIIYFDARTKVLYIIEMKCRRKCMHIHIEIIDLLSLRAIAS